MLHLCQSRSRKGARSFERNCLSWASQLSPKTQGPILHATKLRRSCTQQHSLHQSTSWLYKTPVGRHHMVDYVSSEEYYAVIMLVSWWFLVYCLVWTIILATQPKLNTELWLEAIGLGKPATNSFLCYSLKETSDQQFNNYDPSLNHPSTCQKSNWKFQVGSSSGQGTPMRSL